MYYVDFTPGYSFLRFHAPPFRRSQLLRHLDCHLHGLPRQHHLLHLTGVNFRGPSINSGKSVPQHLYKSHYIEYF